MGIPENEVASTLLLKMEHTDLIFTPCFLSWHEIWVQVYMESKKTAV